jgi:hypothetical protein
MLGSLLHLMDISVHITILRSAKNSDTPNPQILVEIAALYVVIVMVLIPVPIAVVKPLQVVVAPVAVIDFVTLYIGNVLTKNQSKNNWSDF